MPKIVAVLPAYNLERSIGDIVERTKKFADVVIVAADGSSDGTAKAAEAAGAHVPPPERKRGKGFAVIKGFDFSKRFEPDIVVLLDSDGQHLPEEIPDVTRPILESGYDMVFGSRMLGTLKTSTINKFGNFGLKLISALVTGKWMTDTETGFRAFKAKRLYELKLKAIGYEIESEIFLRSLHAGFSFTEVPIHVPIAVPGVTVWDGLKVGWYKLKTGLYLRLGREV